MVWKLVGSWTYATPVPNIEFTGLSSYGDVRVLLRNTTLSGVGLRALQVSINNGAPYLTTTADYIRANSDGSEVGGDSIIFSDTQTTATRDGDMEINMFNLRGPPKIAQCLTYLTVRTTIIPTPERLKAIRIVNNAGYNFTGGNIYVYGR